MADRARRVVPLVTGSATCAFCNIIQGATKTEVVAENDDLLVFLDHRPLFVGHCLVVPKVHYETLLDLPANLSEPLLGMARRVAHGLEQGLGAAGFFVAMNNRISQSVPHLHVHVVPRRKKDGLRGFFWPRTKYESSAQMAETGARIAAAMPE